MNESPKISVVTPSFNQAEYLEETICSILNQGYPNLEYIIIDGGSTDNSVEIIKKYQKHLHFWCSEPDAGHYHAVNKGFSKATGDIFAWLNSDDLYCPWALKTVGSIFTHLPKVEWLTSLNPLKWDDNGYCIKVSTKLGFSKRAFLDGCYLRKDYKRMGFIQQESTFWSKRLWKKIGGIRTKFDLAGDFDLWSRFFLCANLYAVISPLGGFRSHTKNRSLNIKNYIMETEQSLAEMRESFGWREKKIQAKFSKFVYKTPIIKILYREYCQRYSKQYKAKNIFRSTSKQNREWIIKNYYF